MDNKKLQSSKNKTDELTMEQYSLQIASQIEKRRQDYLKSLKGKEDKPAIPFTFYYNDYKQSATE